MKKLVEKARAARKNAYAPYSKFKVGAALEASSGKVYAGCNVENASYAATCCAERVALTKAVSEGERSFVRIAVVAETSEPCPPCGICRQSLHEFSPGMEVIMVGARGRTERASLSDLMPCAFRSASLRGKK